MNERPNNTPKTNIYKPQVTADAYEMHAFHPLRIESITEQLM